MIDYSEDDLVLFATTAKPHFGAWIGKPDGIAEHIEQDLAHPFGITNKAVGFFVQVGFQLNLHVVNAVLRSFDNSGNRFRYIDFAQFQFDNSGLHSGQIQNIIDNCHQ